MKKEQSDNKNEYLYIKNRKVIIIFKKSTKGLEGKVNPKGEGRVNKRELFSQGSGGSGTVPRAVLSLRGVDGKGREGASHEVPLSLHNEASFLRHTPLLGSWIKMACSD